MKDRSKLDQLIALYVGDTMNSDKTYPEYTHAHKYNSTGITEMSKKKEQQKLCENSKNPSMAKKQREQKKKDQQM